ncbi:PREDICTED: uncharacterized protein LOC102019464 [Chinchilla lanigera]|uniref:uncharacterized protein LOC102019464 n=1 Tax=Chinchilla lanigera TaxID=34839 RepID=UPI00038EB06B|nr:PREDICTED: uncharacterized protein LOC102019464 [Chinchilla lanigera]XP_013374479.1 PREDICTED: uncharacterized protein LOC102019464 [Chinchilla lanigera]
MVRPVNGVVHAQGNQGGVLWEGCGAGTVRKPLARSSRYKNNALVCLCSTSFLQRPPRLTLNTHLTLCPLLQDSVGLLWPSGQSSKSFLAWHPGRHAGNPSGSWSPIHLSPASLTLLCSLFSLAWVWSAVCQLHDSEDYLSCPGPYSSRATPRAMPGTQESLFKNARRQATGPGGSRHCTRAPAHKNPAGLLSLPLPGPTPAGLSWVPSMPPPPPGTLWSGTLPPASCHLAWHVPGPGPGTPPFLFTQGRTLLISETWQKMSPHLWSCTVQNWRLSSLSPEHSVPGSLTALTSRCDSDCAVSSSRHPGAPERPGLEQRCPIEALCEPQTQF